MSKDSNLFSFSTEGTSSDVQLSYFSFTVKIVPPHLKEVLTLKNLDQDAFGYNCPIMRTVKLFV